MHCRYLIGVYVTVFVKYLISFRMHTWIEFNILTTPKTRCPGRLVYHMYTNQPGSTVHRYHTPPMLRTQHRRKKCTTIPKHCTDTHVVSHFRTIRSPNITHIFSLVWIPETGFEGYVRNVRIAGSRKSQERELSCSYLPPHPTNHDSVSPAATFRPTLPTTESNSWPLAREMGDIT